MCENFPKSTLRHYVRENKVDSRFMTKSQISVFHSNGMTYIDFLDLEKNPKGRLAIMY